MRNNKTFGERLYDVRRMKKINRSDLGIVVGIEINPSKKIEEYENDRIQPRFDILIKIAKTLDVSLDYLLTGEEYENRNNKNKNL